jgi:hypothetical protein
MDWQNWIPLITSGIMLAFGTALWSMVRNVLKTFDKFLDNKAPKIDMFTEKYLGDQASDEMWRQLRSVGESLVKISDKMIATDSFQKNAASQPGKPDGAITDLSGKLGESNK